MVDTKSIRDRLKQKEQRVKEREAGREHRAMLFYCSLLSI